MAENLLEDGVLFILLEVGHVKLHLGISHLPFQSSCLSPLFFFFFFFSLVWLKT